MSERLVHTTEKFSSETSLRDFTEKKDERKSMKTVTNIIYHALAVFTFASLLSPQAAAICQQGCDIPKANAFLGDDALHSDTTGGENVAIGYHALFSNTTGAVNTAVGSFALAANTIGNENTACGRNALGFNSSGYGNTATGSNALSNNNGILNTATGSVALNNNTMGSSNTADGVWALQNNTTGNGNTGTGVSALSQNLTGNDNTANGYAALYWNTTGRFNTSTGGFALYNNTTGGANVAIGLDALYSNTNSSNNTAVGVNALVSSTGSNNVGLGFNAGHNLTAGNGNICIGAAILGVAGESNTTRIKNVYSSVASARAVYVNSDNKIGTLSSSRRYKEEIKPMDKASETLFALKPVTFRYKKEVDVERALSFGLIAEDVAEVSPQLITRDEKGNPQTVRYEAVNAMLLNEFLKEHRKVQDLEATVAKQEASAAKQQTAIAALQRQIEVLTFGLQKVSAELATASPSGGGFELNKPAPQTALNNR